MPERPAIDRTDARLLERLQVDGRRPYADLGAEVGISGPSAHERVKKLEARGRHPRLRRRSSTRPRPGYGVARVHAG